MWYYICTFYNYCSIIYLELRILNILTNKHYRKERILKMIKKFTNKHRTFKFAPDNKFISVYVDGRLNGFIFNTDKVIIIDGEEIISSEFFK